MPARIRLSTNQTTIDDDPLADARLAEDFARRNAIILPNLLDSGLLEMITALLDKSQFKPLDVAVGKRLVEFPPRACMALCFVLERAPLPQWLQSVTGRGPLRRVTARVSRYEPGPHALHWHSDRAHDSRLLGITINLGREPYQGGIFEMKRQGASDLLCRYTHTEPGTALIFGIHRDIVHRVTPVTAGGPRTVFSGWFQATLPEPRARANQED